MCIFAYYCILKYSGCNAAKIAAARTTIALLGVVLRKTRVATAHNSPTRKTFRATSDQRAPGSFRKIDPRIVVRETRDETRS